MGRDIQRNDDKELSMKDFIEKYQEAQGMPYGYDTFLSDVLANAYTMGVSDWMDIEYEPREAGSFEDGIVQSIKDGTCRFIIEDGEEFVPSMPGWQETIEGDKADRWLQQCLDECDDADTADAILQIWVFGEVVYG